MNLNQVIKCVSDIQQSANFYQMPGLQLIVKSEHYCRFIVPGNEATFSLHLADKPQPGTTVIYFECNDLDEKIAELKRMGIQFKEEVKDQNWLWREAYLEDPDGHVICLYYAGENRLNPPWRMIGS